MNTPHFPFLPTALRVEQSTAQEINARIERQTALNVERIAAGGPAAIEQRLVELDREWDIERTLEANAAAVTLTSLGIGFLVDRRWFAFPIVVAAFLLQHAPQGWCPPLPLFRSHGVRTGHEINLERNTLRIMRGDFSQATHDPNDAFRQARSAGAALS